jgi:hypothetical protein
MRSLQSFGMSSGHLGLRERLENAADQRERRERLDDLVPDVVASDPEIGLERRIERDDDDAPTRDTARSPASTSFQ